MILLLSFIFFITPAISFARVEEEPDRRIVQLNESISTIGMFGVEKVLGKLSLDSKPRTGFVAKWNFHSDGPKILKLIETLEGHTEHEECVRCLNAINEIFYLQLRQLLVELDVSQIDGLQLGMKGMDVSAKGSSKSKKLFGVHSANYVKSKLLEILFKIYDCQNTRRVGLAYSYETLPMAAIMTKAIINILRARAHTKWSYEKQKDFVVQKLDQTKKELLSVFGLVRSQTDISVDDLSGFVDILKTIVIERKQGVAWGKFFKWTFVTGGIIAACAAAVYAGYLISSSLGKEAADRFEQVPRAIDDLRRDIRDIKVTIEHEIGPQTKDGSLMKFLDAARLQWFGTGEKGSFLKFLDAARVNMFEGTEPGAFIKFLNGARENWFESDPGAFSKFLEEARKNWFESPQGPTGKMLEQIAIRLREDKPLIDVNLFAAAGNNGVVNENDNVVKRGAKGVGHFFVEGAVDGGAFVGGNLLKGGAYLLKGGAYLGKGVINGGASLAKGVWNKVKGTGNDEESDEDEEFFDAEE